MNYAVTFSELPPRKKWNRRSLLSFAEGAFSLRNDALPVK